jgi:hypothetical protein
LELDSDFKRSPPALHFEFGRVAARASPRTRSLRIRAIWPSGRPVFKTGRPFFVRSRAYRRLSFEKPTEAFLCNRGGLG